jgi:branched-chain amino acid transport system substrate-binding protein
MGRSYRSGVIALSLAALVAGGCSSSAKKTAASTGSSNATTATTVSSVPIKIGVLLPESGPSAANGAGHKPLLDNILKEPGHATIDGHPVQIVIVDDTGTSSGGAAGAHQLIDQDHVAVIFGSNLTAVATAELPVTTAAKQLEITLTGCPPCGDGKTYPYNFTIEWDRPSQGPATIARVKAMGKSSFAILQSLDPSGQAYVDALTAAASAGGVTISKKVTYQPSTLDLSNQVAQLKSAGVDLVYIAAVSPPDIANVVKAMDEAQYHPRLLGNSALSVPHCL